MRQRSKRDMGLLICFLAGLTLFKCRPWETGLIGQRYSYKLCKHAHQLSPLPSAIRQRTSERHEEIWLG